MRWEYWVTLAVALIGGVPGVIAIYKTICRTKIRVVFNEAQSFVCALDSDDKNINGKYCFGFYELYLVGVGELPTTPKTVNFFVKKGRKWISGNPVRIKTYKIRGVDNCIVLDNGLSKIIIKGWLDLQLANSGPLDFGVPVAGSMSFYFDLTLEEIKTCKHMKFIVEDYLGKAYKYKAKIKEEYFKSLDKNLKIIDRDFIIHYTENKQRNKGL